MSRTLKLRMSDIGKIIFYLIILIPFLSFTFCFVFANKFDVKQATYSSVYLNLILYVLLNTGCLILTENLGVSILMYLLLFAGMHFCDKYASNRGYGWSQR
jgi:predicted permease